METNAERRKRKLIELCNALGGEEVVAEKAELSADSLRQIMKGYRSSYTPKGGSSPSERGLGDPAARAIEEAFGLERGWFDNDQEHMIRTPQELELVALFRQLDGPTQQVVVEAVQAARDRVRRAHEEMRERVAAPATGPETVPADLPQTAVVFGHAKTDAAKRSQQHTKGIKKR